MIRGTVCNRHAVLFFGVSGEHALIGNCDSTDLLEYAAKVAHGLRITVLSYDIPRVKLFCMRFCAAILDYYNCEAD